MKIPKAARPIGIESKTRQLPRGSSNRLSFYGTVTKGKQERSPVCCSNLTMQPASEPLTTLRQKYNTGLIPNPLENARALHQRAMQLQILVDHFRNQLIGDQASCMQNGEYKVSSSDSFPQLMPVEVDVKHRFRSKFSCLPLDLGSEDGHSSSQFVNNDSPQGDNTVMTNIPLHHQINRLIPGLFQPSLSKPVAGQDKSYSLFQPPLTLNPNTLAHLAHLHRLALTAFSHQNGLHSHQTFIPENRLSNFQSSDLPSVTLGCSRASLPADMHSNSQAANTKASIQSAKTTMSTEAKWLKSRAEISPAEQTDTFCAPCEGLNLTVGATKILDSSLRTPSAASEFGPLLLTKDAELQRSSSCYEKPIFGYRFSDFESGLPRDRSSLIPTHDFWPNSYIRQMRHLFSVPFSTGSGRKFPHKSYETTQNSNSHNQESYYECTPRLEEPRLVRLSNCSLKPIDQLTVSDFVSSALHPTANGHASPVAASLTEVLLNHCGLELSWVKLAHIRERPGSQSVWLLFNVSSKRHRLPVGTTERIQGRHSSRMLWPQFSGKSFKMHKKLSFDARKDQPFFVHALGWSSIDPCAAWKIWGLVCRQLTVDDICLVLIRQAGTIRKPRSQMSCPSENNLDGCTPPSASRTQIKQSDRTTAGKDRSVENVISISEVGFRSKKHDQETTLLNNSPHDCFPRNCASLKRTSVDDSDSPKEASGFDTDNPSKRAKTDEPFGQSEDRYEKLIFFSATSLAQSPESTRSAQIRANTPKNGSH